MGEVSAPAQEEQPDPFRERLLNGMAEAIREKGYTDTTISPASPSGTSLALLSANRTCTPQIG